MKTLKLTTIAVLLLACVKQEDMFTIKSARNGKFKTVITPVAHVVLVRSMKTWPG